MVSGSPDLRMRERARGIPHPGQPFLQPHMAKARTFHHMRKCRSASGDRGKRNAAGIGLYLAGGGLEQVDGGLKLASKP